MSSGRANGSRGLLGWAVLAVALFIGAAPGEQTQPTPTPGATGRDTPAALSPQETNQSQVAPSATVAETLSAGPFGGSPKQLLGSAQMVILFGLVSLVPAAILMVTAFIRISIVLTLLRQALGSPQVPSNQVLSALALLLTALVMKPVADDVYTKGIEPFAAGRATPAQAWKASSQPIKRFMLDQIYRTGHERYLRELYDQIEPPSPGRIEPTDGEQLDLRVVAPAFLLSELTTALMIGFAIYLPFLVIDLVVSAVLAAMGLFMMPPSLVAMPLKLVVFVLADGWMLVAGMLLRSFAHI